MARTPWQPRRRANVEAYKASEPTGLTASAAVGSGDQRQKEASAKTAARKAQQKAVWAYRERIGELGHYALFYENTFSRIRLRIAVEEDDGSRSPVFDEEGKELVPGAAEALAVLRELKSPLGGQSGIMRAIGGCLAMVGEGHLVGLDNPLMPSGQAWEFFSPSEFYEAANQERSGPDAAVDYHRVRYPGAAAETVKSNAAVVARIWQPDPEYSLLPWAAPLGMVTIFEELDLLTREVAGAAVSRLVSAGILAVADDLDWPEDESGDDDQTSPLVSDMIRLMAIAKRNPESAAAQLPYVVDVPRNDEGTVAGSFEYVKFDRTWDEKAAAMRAEALSRFREGADLPPETLMGFASSTFANSTQITTNQWTSYVEPKALIATDGLTNGYLRVRLPGTVFVIDPDPTDLIVKPDQTQDYIEGHKLFVISDAALRDKLGATEIDAPDEAEVERRIGIATAMRQPAFPSFTSEPVTGGADLDAAAEIAVRQSLQRVGARIRSKVSGKAGMATMLRNVPDCDVARTLGPATVASLMPDTDLIPPREFAALEAYVTETVDASTARLIVGRVADSLRERLYAR